MKVIVNGEAREVPEGSSVAELVAAMGLADAICAAEVNRSVVPRAARGERRLAEGDMVEIVSLVGGG